MTLCTPGFVQFQTRYFENGLAPTPATAIYIEAYVDCFSERKKGAADRGPANIPGTLLILSRNYESTKQPVLILALKRMYRNIDSPQQQATPLTKPILEQLLENRDNSLDGIRRHIILSLDSETLRCQSKSRAFKLREI